jgi:DNA-directed RNA polymerase subunit alpha
MVRPDARATKAGSPAEVKGTDYMLIIQRPTVEPVGEQEGDRQRFAIGPLEPGFGHTMGVALRRTLLSSIPGAAVTQVRFDEALHEFTSLPGVKEDVTDIILNLKDIVLRVTSDESVTLRVDVRGPSTVTAGDIAQTSDVEILNPELVLATVNGKGRLAADITVERGRGYVSADRNKRSTTIGVIPVDSIFSPIRLVAFSVEPARVEQSTNYDRLVLDITTDGSISPREALASAGDTLRSLVGLVADMSDAPQGLELGDVGAATSGSPDLDLLIEDLDLSERPRNCLKRAQINTVGELVQKSEDDLLAITNFGQKSLDEVLQKLDERGLALRGKEA